MDKDKAMMQLVITRLSVMAPNVKLSIGSHGTFTREEMIDAVKNNTDLGKTIVKMQLN